MSDVVARDVESTRTFARPRVLAWNQWRERTFHGITRRRLVVLALFGLGFALFNWPVALTYARGLPAAQVALALIQTYLSMVLWFFTALFAAVAAWNLVRGGTALRIGAVVLAIGVAVALTFEGSLLIRNAPTRDVYAHTIRYANLWFGNCVIAALATAVLLYVTRSEDVARELEREALRSLDLDRALDEARLQATQAQIEPHFLFNTLANIRRLYEVDREGARAMLRQFSHMLGQSLPDIRTSRSTLGREVALSLAYLSVQKIRMADRLDVATEIPPVLHDAALPPMMLSTLVENAIKHGLAPLPDGGKITISAIAEHDELHVCVTDTGRGLSESSGSGVGLANIETRLAAQFGRAAELALEPNKYGGVTARLVLPLRLVPSEVAHAEHAG